MNILFISYHNFYSNSTIHIKNFAEALNANGQKCHILVPSNAKESFRKHIGVKYGDFTYSNFSQLHELDLDNFDLVHCWTTRNIVRSILKKIIHLKPTIKYVVHLEDNEELITQNAYDCYDATSLKEVLKKIEKVADHLTDPRDYTDFLRKANAVTVIVPELKEFVPSNTPVYILKPILDPIFFNSYSEIELSELREFHGITKETFILTYVGNVHKSNWREVRSLYLAIALAERNGLPVKLIRTGSDYIDFLGIFQRLFLNTVLNLGNILYHKIPKYLALSNLLVQPGRNDKFNRYRLPSKIPEFLASGRPVVIPSCNIANEMIHMHNTIKLNTGDGHEIYKIIKTIYNSAENYQSIGLHGRVFAEEKFSANYISNGLLRFYEIVVNETY